MAIEICDQRKKLIEAHESLLVLGGPGSGKTTIALIKASHDVGLLQKGQKFLFLSFARATVARVAESAAKLTPKEVLKSIEINTYHGFFWNLLRSHGYLISRHAPLRLISPAEVAVEMAQIKKSERQDEYQKLFNEKGIIGFDLFAPKVKELLQKSKKLLRIYSRSYPTIIVDEFQDTNSDEWEIINLLGEHSTIIALADADQRIYEFRGADPARIGQFIDRFKPVIFDFSNENNRSTGRDINTFGNDLLTGANRGKTYNDVSIFRAPYYKSRHEMFTLKANVITSIKRISSEKDWSIAVLVPTKNQMLMASNYFSSQKDNLPVLEHDVAIDAEGPSLAGELFAKLMEPFGNLEEVKEAIFYHLIKHMRGRKGAEPPTQADLKLSLAIQGYLEIGKVRGARREALIKEIETISVKRLGLRMTGNPWDDWIGNIKIFHEFAKESPLINIREDARYVRLLHKGSYLREKLNLVWKDRGCYFNASKLFLDTIQKENFSNTIRKMSGINIMTIHKSKGKQFTEVFLYEGYMRGRFVRNPKDLKSLEQAKLTMRVGVTRARQKATIITPRNKSCELL